MDILCNDVILFRYSLCLTEELVDEFKSLFSSNSQRHLSPVNRANLFTSLVVHPEILMINASIYIRYDMSMYIHQSRLFVLHSDCIRCNCGIDKSYIPTMYLYYF